MADERFKNIELIILDGYVQDNLTDEHLDEYGIIKLLNNLHKEKEQLKKENKYLMDVIFAIKDYATMDDYKSIINAVKAVEQNISRGDF